MQNLMFATDADSVTDEVHKEWLKGYRDELLDFYQPEIRLASGGYAWLDDDGHQILEKGAQLWLGARMIHIFSLAAMLGRPGAEEIVNHGLDFYVDGPGHDHEYGGWFPIVGGDDPQDQKELYGIAHILLAASSATKAGFEKGPRLLEEALEVIDRYFWSEKDRRCLESYDRTFTEVDSYRGQNANMHLTEAFLAAYEVTGNRELLERAIDIAEFIAGRAVLLTSEKAPWRLPEHFDSNWRPMLDHNIDDKRHPFRPYGTQIGHWLEWSKLCMQIRGYGVDKPWLLPTAEILFAKGMEEGWAENGGLYYTLDWEGQPVVAERYFWVPTEAMGAARALWEATDDPYYFEWYRKLWEFADRHFLDHERGGWHHELDINNHPSTCTWQGKPDIYHVFQATLYPCVPTGIGLATWAKDTAI